MLVDITVGEYELLCLAHSILSVITKPHIELDRATSDTPYSYKCSTCGNTYGKEWTDEEALEETADLFGEGWNKENCDVVCEDCYINTNPSEGSNK